MSGYEKEASAGCSHLSDCSGDTEFTSLACVLMWQADGMQLLWVFQNGAALENKTPPLNAECSWKACRNKMEQVTLVCTRFADQILNGLFGRGQKGVDLKCSLPSSWSEMLPNCVLRCCVHKGSTSEGKHLPICFLHVQTLSQQPWFTCHWHKLTSDGHFSVKTKINPHVWNCSLYLKVRSGLLWFEQGAWESVMEDH